ncbi:Serine/threonine-protein kinase PknF [Gemmata obscuriglobus]|uniref:Protein kinase domain-containing protein n=1 Tax=Gemmata obscuriglobus TaxID=114 RepID=A0A2Z3H8B7_9BACT|nr:serine/threonine-protein kinase [Gemmata obscuriglobus]AWM37944.1 hypothetical protein C1280_13720 [Gemmata obscuriglobus]QEG29199.1 Serine/threonine-protein kinase PknF [Gemmata obscuriglobus]VTS07975.1 serine threonine protein kinase : Serine/threonine protein kinase OS=Rhodopirellula europaea SH398 GN=RESH_01050 PE=3 SV=1: Pkinase [Gemmata obscuriglobus UQM 2246]
MPSDSIAGFLDTAKASRVLFPEQVEHLIRQPDVPLSDLSALCSYLQERGVLSKFQADALREGRAQELTFGAYPVLDVIGPCPGGTAYRVLHPSLRTPLVLRRFEPNGFAPADTPQAVVERARAFGTLAHPNLLPLLDAGVHHDQLYAVLEQPADAAPLDALVQEVGGAMPGFLAAEYGWAVASALRVIHERGGCHGEVRPGLLLVGPLTTKVNPDGTTKRRPAPNASVKLTETGLIPVREPAAFSPPPAEVLAYLPPERLDSAERSPTGDLYGLAACLYLMLAGRSPFAAETLDELIHKVRTADPAPLHAVRPDVPADLSTFVTRMLAKQPADRPQTASEVVAGLAPFCRPGVVPVVAPAPVPMALPLSGVGAAAAPPTPSAPPAPVVVAIPLDGEPEPDAWGVDPRVFTDAHDAPDEAPRQTRRRRMTDQEKRRAKLWLVVGLCLHLSAMATAAAWLGGCFNSSQNTAPPARPAGR